MKHRKDFKTSGFRPLSQTEMDILIYMNSDIWITPELKRFKNEIIEKMGGKK
jgi:hypothetical protein